ncbi:MAG: hypothetical protein NC228_05760, partial [[Eubacterium] siraeum]|nr:hypothetical protein [[Eubacterium] siraeum]
MKKLRYIIAASVAALSLSTCAYAVGDAVDDIGSGVGDAIDGAGDAVEDIMGGDNTTGADAGDVTSEGEITSSETTAADVAAASETTTAETTSPTVVAGSNNKNPGTGVVAGFTAIGAAVAGLTAVAAKKR